MKSLLQRRVDILVKLEKRGLKIKNGSIIPRWICTSDKRKHQPLFRHGVDGYILPQNDMYNIFVIGGHGSFIHVNNKRTKKLTVKIGRYRKSPTNFMFFDVPTIQQLEKGECGDAQLKMIEEWLGG